MNRDQAWQIVTEFVQSDSLRKHMLSVEYAMRAYAAYYGEDTAMLPEPDEAGAALAWLLGAAGIAARGRLLDLRPQA